MGLEKLFFNDCGLFNDLKQKYRHLFVVMYRTGYTYIYIYIYIYIYNLDLVYI